jgi:WD40 repeat protein
MSFKEPEPQKCKQPIRPETVQYKLLEETVPGYVQLEPLQIISDCYNEGSTPKFNFSTDCAENNYVRSCKFSPTGTHLITDSEDRRIRIFDFDEEKATLKKSILNGDLIYDLIWDPFGENFVTTSGGSPIKLWDCDGNQIASYHGINHFDELDFAYCMAFDLNGQKLYAGYCGIIRRFDVEKPGAQISEFKTYGKILNSCFNIFNLVKKQGGQRSILSCIDMSPAMQGVFCVGSFNSCVGLYSDYTNSCDLLIPTKNRFITCVKYGSNGTQIYVGGRKVKLTLKLSYLVNFRVL